MFCVGGVQYAGFMAYSSPLCTHIALLNPRATRRIDAALRGLACGGYCTTLSYSWRLEGWARVPALSWTGFGITFS